MKRIIATGAIVLSLFSSCVSPTPAQAQGFAQEAINRARETAGQADLDTRQSLTNIIADIIQVILGIVGILFFLLTLYGGFLWMSAQGNDEKVATAKKIIVRAVLGMVIVLAAYSISYFVATSVESVIP